MDPPTQSDVQQLFVTPSGTPLSVFAQAEEIPGRPRIAKLLKKRGAAIQIDPKAADVILVNDDTDVGKQFVRVWSNDGDKVVLHYRWVEKCVAAGRLLKEGDDWGGCMTQSDGKSLDDDDDEEDASETEAKRSPSLPTPRQTKSPPNPPAPKPPSTKQKKRTTQPASAPSRPDPPADAAKDEVQCLTPEDFANMTHEQFLSICDLLQKDQSPQVQAEVSKFIAAYEQYGPAPPRAQEDVHMRSPTPPPRVSAKALGKQRDVSTSSRKTSISHPPPSPTKSSSPPASRFRFVDKKGEPLNFYVQFVHVRRKVLVTSIKKYGGNLVSDIKAAHFAVIFPNVNSKDCQNIVNSATNSGVPAILSTFVDDCISAGKVLDYKDYLFNSNEKKRRLSEDPESSDSDSSDEPISQKAKKHKAAVTATPSAASSTKKPPSKASKPPKPAPAPKPALKKAESSNAPATSTKGNWQRGNRYTEEEIQGALDLCFEMYRANEFESRTQLTRKLHEKYPTHTQNSWLTYISQGVKKQEFDDAQKRGAIQFRKRKAQLENEAKQRARSIESVASQQTNAITVSSRASPEPTPAAPPPPAPRREERPQAVRTVDQDIDRLAHFLAFEGGDTYDHAQDLAFQALSKLAPWRTSDSWKDFWSIHYEKVLALYEAKMATDGAS